MKLRIEPERAKAIGRMLFQKYDLGKRGALGPKQCYELFSDFCYRILVRLYRWRPSILSLRWRKRTRCTKCWIKTKIKRSLNQILKTSQSSTSVKLVQAWAHIAIHPLLIQLLNPAKSVKTIQAVARKSQAKVISFKSLMWPDTCTSLSI